MANAQEIFEGLQPCADGNYHWREIDLEELERIILAERERCAKVAEGFPVWSQSRDVAAAIRNGTEYLNGKCEWLPHNGQGAPDLPPGTRVQVRTRDGWVDPSPQSVEFWDIWFVWPVHSTLRRPSDDIVAYRVVDE